MAKSIMAILAAIVPLALKIVGMYLEKSSATKEHHKKFYDFVDAMEQASTVTSKLRQKYAQQRAKSNAMIKAIEAKEGIK